MTKLRVAVAILWITLLLAAVGMGACLRGGDAKVALCSDYQTWSSAQRAYEQGARQLDGDGDGISCESLL